MTAGVGRVVLALSAAGYPLTQLAIRRGRLGGALMVEAACAGLLVRDALLLARGVTRQLRRGPAVLLWLETAAAATAALASLRPLMDARARTRTATPHPNRPEAVRRTTIAVLFALHTVRVRIYLRPDRGLRAEARDVHAAERAGGRRRRAPPCRDGSHTRNIVSTVHHGSQACDH